MTPALQPDDYLLLLTRGFRRWLKAGRLVMFRHPEEGLMVKRVRRFDNTTGTLEVAGDSALSAAPEALGPVPLDRVIGLGILPIRA